MYKKGSRWLAAFIALS
ncbi:KxYKxGKxW signal peptide domain-containing protein [Glaciecola sp. SC05]